MQLKRRGWRLNVRNAESTIANTITKTPKLKLKRSRSIKQKTKKKSKLNNVRRTSKKMRKILESFTN